MSLCRALGAAIRAVCASLGGVFGVNQRRSRVAVKAAVALENRGGAGVGSRPGAGVARQAVGVTGRARSGVPDRQLQAVTTGAGGQRMAAAQRTFECHRRMAERWHARIAGAADAALQLVDTAQLQSAALAMTNRAGKGTKQHAAVE